VQPGQAQHQLSLAPINLLPNAPSTYEMRDWRQVAADFHALAFDTTATGQFVPLPRRDDTPESPHLELAYELPSYVGETRTYGNGEAFAEGIPTLGAILGSTLIGIDKAAGPLNWVSMTREYYIDRNNEFIYMNRTDSASGHSAWYDIFPNILFYNIADHYPSEPYLSGIQDQIDARFYTAVNVMTAGGAAPNFNYSAFDFSDSIPRYNGTWREPDMGLGMAWMQHAAYWRNRQVDPTAAAQHLQAVDWALAYYETRSSNPHYEILTPFGAYTAARMNAEHGRNYNVHKYLDWVFSRSAVRVDLIMISGEQWGGQDVGGLMGGMRPNTSNVQGYAFAMNTYATALPAVPLVRYEDRYSRAIGKWMLNAASAARLFYANAHPPQNQSSEFWTGDPQSSIAYEGLRHNWLPPQLLKPGESTEIYAAGDPLTYGWGPLTDFGIYGSAFTGVFGSIIKTTNVEKVLQLDLLATDSYRGNAYPTYLYYNPHPNDVSVSIDLGDGAYDLYDAVSNQFLIRNATGSTYFNIPRDNAVQLVVTPAGGVTTRVGRRLLINDIMIDYNAALLPNNLLANPDVDSPVLGTASSPTGWNRSSSAVWATDDAFSPTHSLKLADNSNARLDEWRSYATAIPEGLNRELELSWFWKYDIDPGSEFRARLRLSASTSTGPTLISPGQEINFILTGEAADFEHFTTTISLPDWASTFDLSFISGGLASQLGTLYVDDISVALFGLSAISADYDEDGDVDGSDFLTWQTSLGSHVAPGTSADGDHDGMIDGDDLAVWRAEMANVASLHNSALSVVEMVPEPVIQLNSFAACLAFIASVFSGPASRGRRRLTRGPAVGYRSVALSPEGSNDWETVTIHHVRHRFISHALAGGLSPRCEMRLGTRM
jgi:hypothetical protein